MDLKNSLRSLQIHLKRGIFPVDYLLLGYNFILILFCIIFYEKIERPWLLISVNLLIALIIFNCIYFEKGNYRSFNFWLHTWLPIITLSVYYTESTVIDHIIFPVTFDSLLSKWDINIFNIHINEILAPLANSQLVDQIMHIFYFSFFLFISIPVLFMLLRKYHRVYEMIFTLTLMMFAHYLFFIFFPADGPISDREFLFPDRVYFISIMDWIYRFSEQGGGAFPSTHVAASIIVFLYSYKFFKNLRWLLVVFCIGIVLSTVYCSYHYAIDSVAGIITGILFYFIGKNIYAMFGYPLEVSFES